MTGRRPSVILEEGAGRGDRQAPDAASLCLAQLAVCAAERNDPRGRIGLRPPRALDGRVARFTHRAGLGAGAGGLRCIRDARGPSRRGESGGVSSARICSPAIDDSLAWLSAEARILVARVSLGLGHVARARELLADASRLARRTPDVVVFERWFDDAWGQFDERAETTLAGMGSLTTAELRVLRFLPTHYPFHEIAQRLHVSSNTVKTHVHAVYRKLDASSRSEAVATATRAGLLGG